MPRATVMVLSVLIAVMILSTKASVSSSGGASGYAARLVPDGMYSCGAATVAGTQPLCQSGSTSARPPTLAGESTSVPSTGTTIGSDTGSAQPGFSGPTSRRPHSVGSPSM